MSALEHEAAFWGDCANTWGEEFKQSVYAKLMGLETYGSWPHFDLQGRSVVDLGGGPVSMLLKTVNGRDLTVVDPCQYPTWVAERYGAHGIVYVAAPAERFTTQGTYDEAWIYNVLQHVMDPELVIETALNVARRVRIFEWIEIPADTMHPHVLRAEQLEEWLGWRGSVVHGVNAAWGETHLAKAWVAVTPGLRSV